MKGSFITPWYVKIFWPIFGQRRIGVDWADKPGDKTTVTIGYEWRNVTYIAKIGGLELL